MTSDDSVVHCRSGKNSMMSDRGSSQTMSVSETSMSKIQTTMSVTSMSQTTMTQSQTTMTQSQTMSMAKNGCMTDGWNSIGSVADNWTGVSSMSTNVSFKLISNYVINFIYHITRFALLNVHL